MSTQLVRPTALIAVIGQNGARVNTFDAAAFAAACRTRERRFQERLARRLGVPRVPADGRGSAHVALPKAG